MDPHATSKHAPNTSNSTPKLEHDPNQPEGGHTAHAHLREVALGVPGVARALGIGRPLAVRLLRGGSLRVHVVGGRMWVLRSDLERWLANSDAPKGGAQ